MYNCDGYKELILEKENLLKLKKQILEKLIDLAAVNKAKAIEIKELQDNIYNIQKAIKTNKDIVNKLDRNIEILLKKYFSLKVAIVILVFFFSFVMFTDNTTITNHSEMKTNTKLIKGLKKEP